MIWSSSNTPKKVGLILAGIGDVIWKKLKVNLHSFETIGKHLTYGIYWKINNSISDDTKKGTFLGR